MEISRADLQLKIAPFRPLIIPEIIKTLNPSKTLDPKVSALANGSSAFFLTQFTSPLEFVGTLTSFVAVATLWDKVVRRSPKPLRQLFVKTLTLSAISCLPALTVKLALYAIRQDARIDMNDRKERTLYIISSIALGALMTPHFLKIHRKTYPFCPKGVAQYALTQIIVHIAVAEIFDWNDRNIAEEIRPLSHERIESLIKYRDIGHATQAVIDRKFEEAQGEIDEALAGRAQWKQWMDTAPIKEDQITLPPEPNPQLATFMQNHPNLLKKLTIPAQIEWGKAFNRRGKTAVFPIPLTDEYLPFINGDALPFFHQYFTKTPFFFLLSEDHRNIINKRFAEYRPEIAGGPSGVDHDSQELEEKPESPPVLAPIQKALLPSFSLEIQHQFYSHENKHVPVRYRWSSLPFAEKHELNEAFKAKGLAQLSFL
ncbi:MAG: hypothetical protein H7A41_02120 [Chlamydiales bacterium]|nr:hypothetical protein [Chlamydiales bacterium]